MDFAYFGLPDDFKNLYHQSQLSSIVRIPLTFVRAASLLSPRPLYTVAKHLYMVVDYISYLSLVMTVFPYGFLVCN